MYYKYRKFRSKNKNKKKIISKKKYWLPLRYFNPTAPSGRYPAENEPCECSQQQNGGNINDNLSDAHPTTNGIPLTKLTTFKDWYLGSECFNCKPSRSSPLAQDFKTEDQQNSKPINYTPPEMKVHGFPNFGIPSSTNPLYLQSNNMSEYNDIPAALAGGKKIKKKKIK
jgi:hypothetical protein